MAEKLRPLVIVWAVLMALLMATILATDLPIGPWRQVISLGIGAIKAALILWWFMELRREGGFTRLFAFGTAAFLAIIFVLFSSDYLTRGWMGT